MEWVSNFITEIYKYLNQRDDRGIDRLNRLYTVAILSAFVTLISSQQYVVGKHIVCWTPQDFTGAQNFYAQDICWLGHTNYYISENLTTLDSPSTPRAYPFLIYPWLPVVLIGMTVSFAIPYFLIWHGLSTRSGLDIKRIMALDKQNDLILAIHFILFRKYSMKTNGGIYVICIYLLMKIFYILNLFCQIILINKLLIGNYFEINIQQIFQILSVKYNMWSSAHFPIETMCDFMIRMLGMMIDSLLLNENKFLKLGQNNNWYTIQCILPFNLFTKRIFAILIIWFIILLILNLIDFVFIWLWQRLWLSSNRYNYIQRLFDLYEMHLHNNKNQMIILAINDQKFCQEFVYKYLGIDGYFLLKLLHAKSSDMKMSYLVVNLLSRFREEKIQQAKRFTQHNDNTVSSI